MISTLFPVHVYGVYSLYCPPLLVQSIMCLLASIRPIDHLLLPVHPNHNIARRILHLLEE